MSDPFSEQHALLILKFQMPKYNFAIKRGDTGIQSLENVPLPKPADPWSFIETLTSQFVAPGVRIIVKHDEGRVLIMVGVLGKSQSVDQGSA